MDASLERSSLPFSPTLYAADQPTRSTSIAEGPARSSVAIKGKHIPALDGLRGVAILMVVFHHLTFLEYSHNRFDLALGHLMNSGWGGVELFFVLSGYLITGILLDARGKANYFRDFYARRTVRIFPLYYAYLFFFLVIARFIPMAEFAQSKNLEAGAPSHWWYWSYCSNFLMARTGFYSILDSTWSLAIEEQFYWFWPVLVLAAGRKKMIPVCYTLLVAGVGVRLFMAMHGVSFPAAYVLTPTHMDGLLVGGVIACYSRSEKGIAQLRTPFIWLGSACAIFIAIMTAIAWNQGVTVREQTWTQVPIYTAAAMVGGTVLIFAAMAQPRTLVGRFFNSSFLRAFGKYSYAIYLFNIPVEIIFAHFFNHRHWLIIDGSRITEQLTRYVVCVTLVFIAGWLSWNLFEVWFLKLKKRFPAAATDKRDPASLASS